MQPLSGNHRPHLLTSLMNMSLVLRLPRKMHLGRSSSNAPRLPWLLEMLQNPHVLLTFDKVHNPLRLPRKTTLQRPKVARACIVLNILASKCASRHNGVHLFDISTSKSGPNLLLCFVHFNFEICFAPQQRALFRQSKLRAVLRTWGAFSFFTCKCASRHNGVQLFISHLRRFSEPTFRPSGATNHWKNTVFRGFPTFSRTWIFLLLRLSLFWSSFFFSSLLWLFPSLLFICPYCRKFGFQTSLDYIDKKTFLGAAAVRHLVGRRCANGKNVMLEWFLIREKSFLVWVIQRWLGEVPNTNTNTNTNVKAQHAN